MISFLRLNLFGCLWCLWLVGVSPLQAMEPPKDPEVHDLYQGQGPDYITKSETFVIGTSKLKYSFCYQPGRISLTEEDKEQRERLPSTPYPYVIQEGLVAKVTTEEPEFYKQSGSSTSDTRLEVKDPSQWPHCVHGHLMMRFGEEESIVVGSGILVGPNHVLTAAHNLHNHNKKGKWASEVWFSPGRKGDQFPFRRIKGKILLCAKEWIDQSRKKDDYDLGMVILNRAIGNKTGWSGLLYAPDIYFEKWEITVTGYPGEKGGKDYYSTQMWEKTSRVKEGWFTRETIYYEIPTSFGQSGGAIWRLWPSSFSGSKLSLFTIGIHTDGNLSGKNKGVRLTKDKFDRIVGWIKAHHLPKAACYSIPEPALVALKHMGEEREENDWWNKGKRYFDKQEYNKAFTCFFYAARKAGDNIPDHILLELARCYREEKGTVQNYLEAFNLYIQTESLRNSPAVMFLIGESYLKGLGVPKNISSGEHFLRMAAEANDINAINELYLLHSTPGHYHAPYKAEEYLKQAHALGKNLSLTSRQEESPANSPHESHTQNKGKEKKIDTEAEEEIKEDAHISVSEQPLEEPPEAPRPASFFSLENFTVNWKNVLKAICVMPVVILVAILAVSHIPSHSDAPVFPPQTFETPPAITQSVSPVPPPGLIFSPNGSFTNTSGGIISIIPPSSTLKILSDEALLNRTLDSWGLRFNDSLVPFDLPGFSHGPYFIESVPWGNDESYLLQLGNKLHAKKDFTPLTGDKSSQVALTGLGGSGKTSLALAYAYLAQDRQLYEVICWIKVVDRDSVIDKYIDLVKELDKSIQPERDAQKLLGYLKNALKGKKVLWVYDNVPNKKVLQDLLPSRGHIIITSRLRKEATNWGDSLEIKGFSIEESVEYLFNRIERITKNDNNTPLAEKLAKELQCFPLALAQAASFIQRTPNGFGEYLKLFEKNGSRMLDIDMGDPQSSYEHTVATTWKITIDNMPQLSKDLMSYFSYLNADDIPVSLFKDSSIYRDREIEIDKALMDLFDYSMIEYNTLGHVSLHRLVQKVQQDEYKKANKSQEILQKIYPLFLERVPSLFNSDFDDLDAMKEVFKYALHLRSLLAHSERLKINDLNNFDCQRIVWVQRALYIAFKSFVENNLPKKNNNEGRLDHIDQKFLFYSLNTTSESLDWLLIASQDAHPSFQIVLGNMLLWGSGTEPNLNLAFKLYNEAVKKGYPKALYNCALMYLHGVGVYKDYISGLIHAHNAARKGYVHAQFLLGDIYKKGEIVPKDMKEAFKWYYEAAQQGHPEAQYIIGLMYCIGEEGVVQQDLTRALEWFCKAAYQGHIQASQVIHEWERLNYSVTDELPQLIYEEQ
ncbi:NB-ARC domain-containing protein [Candidatus Paracaedibacter symbiosus]|uniref:NB-ARC domain-containing protein n=1 Tax=Candidatus Paracaedibacter symbiosus TaxID=244582 RepID=UPI00068EF425|nr:NB-ARC domain-containing protein [Candidatus Paracaedibacter symbiosus]